MDLTRLAVMGTTARTPSGATNAYLIGRDRALLLDPANQTDDLDAAVEDHTVANVALTHHHGDHTSGLPAYAAQTDATVWARAGREDEFEAATGVEPDRTFREGTRIQTDQGPVTVIETPGHAPEHVAFEWVTDDGRSLATGDLAVEPGTVVVGHPQGDMRAYLSSLRRLHARDPRRLYPGHGNPIDDARSTLKRLIDHRRDRERRVIGAVRDGASSVSAITDAAYDKDVSNVRGLAEATVRAHLEKLVTEGRIEWTDDVARPA